MTEKEEIFEKQLAFNGICDWYAHKFAKKHEYDFDYWVGDRTGEIAVFNEEFFVDLSTIRYDIDKEIDSEEFEKWWFYSLDLEELECPQKINYESWCKGAPLPYSREELEHIRILRNEVARMKENLEKFINDAKGKNRNERGV